MSSSESKTKPSLKICAEAMALELTCPMCLQLFSEPVSLPCGHVYCFACIQMMAEGLDQHSCPECQTEYRGTEDIVKSVKMCSIIETYKSTTGSADPSAKLPDISLAIGSDGSPFMDKSNTECHQEAATAGASQEGSSGNGFRIGSGSAEFPFPSDREKGSGKRKAELEEPKFRLASQVTELTLQLEIAEDVLKKERELEDEVTAANAQQRERASRLLGRIMDLAQSFGAQVTRLIEEELRPGEASVRGRVDRASELTEQLRRAVLRAESLLSEEDEAAFALELQSLQPHIAGLMVKPAGEEEGGNVETKVDPRRACPRLERMNAELRDELGEIQRSLRNVLNPSEVTFDPETAHPNLALSEDLKTVTFSATKQPYPSSPQRFTSFFQVLSAQSFCEGDHCWEVELEGAPWIIGLCYRGNLARAGLPSALESSRSSWCLMWSENRLTAFEQGHNVPLRRTTVSCRLEIRLSFKTHRLSFYNVSPTSGKTHVYTFEANLTEPLHLAYRMMSGHPKGRVTICS